jgi:hypothetical protein
MKTTTHTQTPWTVAPTSNKMNGSAWRDIVSTGGEFSPAYVGEAIDRDAELIVRAVNSHAAMLAALEDASFALDTIATWDKARRAKMHADGERDSICAGKGYCEINADKARAAIAAAKGEVQS